MLKIFPLTKNVNYFLNNFTYFSCMLIKDNGKIKLKKVYYHVNISQNNFAALLKRKNTKPLKQNSIHNRNI